jgi:hypothetical protein
MRMGNRKCHLSSQAWTRSRARSGAHLARYSSSWPGGRPASSTRACATRRRPGGGCAHRPHHRRVRGGGGGRPPRRSPPPRRRSTRGPSGGIPATWAAARNCDESAAGDRSGRCRYFRSASAGSGRRRGPARRSSPARRPGVPRRAGPRSRARGPTRCRPTRAASCVSSSWKPAIPKEPAEHRDSRSASREEHPTGRYKAGAEAGRSRRRARGDSPAEPPSCPGPRSSQPGQLKYSGRLTRINVSIKFKMKK